MNKQYEYIYMNQRKQCTKSAWATMTTNKGPAN